MIIDVEVYSISKAMIAFRNDEIEFAPTVEVGAKVTLQTDKGKVFCINKGVYHFMHGSIRGGYDHYAFLIKSMLTEGTFYNAD